MNQLGLDHKPVTKSDWEQFKIEFAGAPTADLTLTALQCRVSENSAEYRRLFDACDMERFTREGIHPFSPIHASYEGDYWMDQFVDPSGKDGRQPCHEAFKVLKALLGKAPLINLGGSGLLDMPEQWNVGLYVDVNLYRTHENQYFSSDYSHHVVSERTSCLLRLGVQSEMLEFVSKIPTGTVNFTINGMGEGLIKYPPYWEALHREMARATIPGGVVFGIGSWTFASTEQLGLQRIAGKFGDLEIFRRVAA